MKSSTPKFNSIFIVYVTWVFIGFINFTFTFYTSDFKGEIGADISQYFLTMFAAMFIVIHGVGATLAWYTQKGKKLAKWLFILFCLLFALDSFFSLIEIIEIYKHTANYHPFTKSLSIIVWLSIAVMAWRKNSNK